MRPSLHYLQVLLPIVAAALFTTTASAQQPCLKKAWATLNQADYAGAIEASTDCIDQFAARAMREQASLEAAHEKQPPTGAVESSFDKKKIFDRWAVNDIATAYFIRGQAAERLLKRRATVQYKELAHDSYTAATHLSYGRCWDPQGWFWSPAEAAADRLAVLK